jgi:hypothetical protein
MTDVWFCSSCHSLNRQRDSRCYKCHTAQDPTSGAPPTRVDSAIAVRMVRRYRSTRLLAVLAIVPILVIAALGFAITIAGLADVDWLRDQVARLANGGTIDAVELARRTDRLAQPILVRTLIAIAAIVIFATWLSRVIANIPALGGGTPSTTPARAFVYTLIPLWNLIKVPGIILDALYRVEPRAGGFLMVALAWFGLVGSWLITFIGSFAISARLAAQLASAGSTDDKVAALQAFVDQSVALDLVTSAMVAAGGIVLVVLIIRIERRSSARDREIRAAANVHGASEVAGAPVAAGVGPLVTRPAAAPAPDPTTEPPAEVSAAEAERLDAIRSRSITSLTASSRSTEAPIARAEATEAMEAIETSESTDPPS